MVNLALLFGIIHDAVDFAERTCKAKTGEEKKEAAKDFLKKEVNKVPGLSATFVDDVVVDSGIEAAVKFMNKFKKKGGNEPK